MENSHGGATDLDAVAQREEGFLSVAVLAEVRGHPRGRDRTLSRCSEEECPVNRRAAVAPRVQRHVGVEARHALNGNAGVRPSVQRHVADVRVIANALNSRVRVRSGM